METYALAVDLALLKSMITFDKRIPYSSISQAENSAEASTANKDAGTNTV